MVSAPAQKKAEPMFTDEHVSELAEFFRENPSALEYVIKTYGNAYGIAEADLGNSDLPDTAARAVLGVIRAPGESMLVDKYQAVEAGAEPVAGKGFAIQDIKTIGDPELVLKHIMAVLLIKSSDDSILNYDIKTSYLKDIADRLKQLLRAKPDEKEAVSTEYLGALDTILNDLSQSRAAEGAAEIGEAWQKEVGDGGAAAAEGVAAPESPETGVMAPPAQVQREEERMVKDVEELTKYFIPDKTPLIYLSDEILTLPHEENPADAVYRREMDPMHAASILRNVMEGREGHFAFTCELGEGYGIWSIAVYNDRGQNIGEIRGAREYIKEVLYSAGMLAEGEDIEHRKEYWLPATQETPSTFTIDLLSSTTDPALISNVAAAVNANGSAVIEIPITDMVDLQNPVFIANLEALQAQLRLQGFACEVKEDPNGLRINVWMEGTPNPFEMPTEGASAPASVVTADYFEGFGMNRSDAEKAANAIAAGEPISWRGAKAANVDEATADATNNINADLQEKGIAFSVSVQVIGGWLVWSVMPVETQDAPQLSDTRAAIAQLGEQIAAVYDYDLSREVAIQVSPLVIKAHAIQLLLDYRQKQIENGNDVSIIDNVIYGIMVGELTQFEQNGKSYSIKYSNAGKEASFTLETAENSFETSSAALPAQEQVPAVEDKAKALGDYLASLNTAAGSINEQTQELSSSLTLISASINTILQASEEESA